MNFKGSGINERKGERHHNQNEILISKQKERGIWRNW